MQRLGVQRGVSPFARPFPHLTKEAMGEGIAGYTFSRTQRGRWRYRCLQSMEKTGGCIWHLVLVIAP